ncbi:MAG: HdeD family acid-resistance protein [Candidatus Entotheonellia bacterium]
MLSTIMQRWWILLLRGISATLFGVLAIVWPGITLLTLVIIYGVVALIDGIVGIALGIRGGVNGRTWWEMILLGLLGVIAGAVTFLWPGLTAVVLLVVIALWAIIRGILEIIGAITLRKIIQGEWLLILSGVLSIGFGVLLLLQPAAGALAVMWLIGIYLIAFGITTIALSLRLRRLRGS